MDMDRLSEGHAKQTKVDKSQRKVALRVVRAYRTVPIDAALVLAVITPIHLQTEKRDFFYKRQKARR